MGTRCWCRETLRFCQPKVSNGTRPQADQSRGDRLERCSDHIYRIIYSRFSSVSKIGCNCLKRLVGPPGFEPGTSCTPSKRASQAAPRPDAKLFYHKGFRDIAQMRRNLLNRALPPNGPNRSHTSNITGVIGGRRDLCLFRNRFRSARIFSFMTPQSVRSSSVRSPACGPPFGGPPAAGPILLPRPKRTRG